MICMDNLITGDTLFVFGCGRCDLAGGDPEQMAVYELHKLGIKEGDPSWQEEYENLLPALEFAVEALNLREVIVSGH